MQKDMAIILMFIRDPSTERNDLISGSYCLYLVALSPKQGVELLLLCVEGNGAI